MFGGWGMAREPPGWQIPQGAGWEVNSKRAWKLQASYPYVLSAASLQFGYS